MVFQKNIKAWLLLSAVLLVSVAILGLAVHAGTANADKRSRESCSSTAHKQFHTEAKKAIKEWWDQAEPRDEKGHQKFLKELKKQHTAFHKAMRGKLSCAPVSLPTSSSVSSTSLPVAKSGSTVPTVGSPSKRAAPSPSPAAPSVSVPSPSGNGSPSPSVPVPVTTLTLSPIISPSTSPFSSSSAVSSLSQVSSASSSGALVGSSSVPSSTAATSFFSPITVRNITEEIATFEWTTAEPSIDSLSWGIPENTSYGGGEYSLEVSPSTKHSVTAKAGWPFAPGTTYLVRAQARIDNPDGTSSYKLSDFQTFQTLPIADMQGNATATSANAPYDHYSVTFTDPDGIQYAITPMQANNFFTWHRPSPSCSTSITALVSPATFDRPTMMKDCAGNWSKFSVQKPPQ